MPARRPSSRSPGRSFRHLGQSPFLVGRVQDPPARPSSRPAARDRRCWSAVSGSRLPSEGCATRSGRAALARAAAVADARGVAVAGFFGSRCSTGSPSRCCRRTRGRRRPVVGGMLLAGFANLCDRGRGAARWRRVRRRRRPDLPQLIATDYVGAALCGALAAVDPPRRAPHRPAIAAEHDRKAAATAVVGAYVHAHAPEWEPGVPSLDLLRLQSTSTGPACPGATRGARSASSSRPPAPPALHRETRWSPTAPSARSAGFARARG